MKATVSEFCVVLRVGIWRSLGSSDIGALEQLQRCVCRVKSIYVPQERELSYNALR